MNPLVYYYVPQAYMEKSACVLEWNREEWVEIRLVDSETIYENKSLKENFDQLFCRSGRGSGAVFMEAEGTG